MHSICSPVIASSTKAFALAHGETMMQARPLDMAEVLALLRQVSTTALQDYLSFLVLDLHTQDPALATEFILLLADAALALMPLPDLR